MSSNQHEDRRESTVKRILCVGVITADIVFFLPEPAIDSVKYRAQGYQLKTGGCAYMAAYAIADLGGQPILLAPIGTDPLAHVIHADLQRHKIDHTAITEHPTATTPCSSVLVTQDGSRTIVNYRDPDLFINPPKIPDLNGIDAVLMDTRWPEAIRATLQQNQNAGIPIVIDAEAPVGPVLPDLVGASHLAFSEQGLTELTGQSNPHDGLRQVRAQTPAWLCVTRGEKSVICLHDEEFQEISPPKTHPTNTLGAGDVWHGAFTLALARGMNEQSAVRYANQTAAHHICQPIQDTQR